MLDAIKRLRQFDLGRTGIGMETMITALHGAFTALAANPSQPEEVKREYARNAIDDLAKRIAESINVMDKEVRLKIVKELESQE